MTYQIAGFRTIILLQKVSKGIKTAWFKPIGDKKRTKSTPSPSFPDALKSARKPLSREEWTERADKLYTDHGGKSNLNETRWSLNYVIAVLAGLDIAIETEKGFQLKG